METGTSSKGEEQAFTCIPFEPAFQENVETFFRHVFDSMGFSWVPEDKDRDIRNIAETYQRDGGQFWILLHEDRVVGTIALRNLGHHIAELKRFYLLPDMRGMGQGRRLLDVAIHAARSSGFKLIRLDTTSKSQAALRLFYSVGFRDIPRYNSDPYAEVFLELTVAV